MPGVNARVSREDIAKIIAIRKNFGHAGPAFVRELVKRGWHRKGEEIAKKIADAAEKLAGLGATGAKSRSAIPLAAVKVAGELAQEFGVLPKELDIAGAVNWAWGTFKGSTEARALDEGGQIVPNISEWIARRWGSCIRPTTDKDSYKEGEAWYDDHAIYIPAKTLAVAAGGALTEKDVADKLKEGKYLQRYGTDRIALHNTPGRGRFPCYALSTLHFGPGAIAEEQTVVTQVEQNASNAKREQEQAEEDARAAREHLDTDSDADEDADFDEEIDADERPAPLPWTDAEIDHAPTLH